MRRSSNRMKGRGNSRGRSRGKRRKMDRMGMGRIAGPRWRGGRSIVIIGVIAIMIAITIIRIVRIVISITTVRVTIIHTPNPPTPIRPTPQFN